MPSVMNQEVTSYKYDVFRAPTLDHDRSVRLELENGHTVLITFPPTPPSDYVTIGTSFHQVQLPQQQFDEIIHMLQTEKPVFFSAYELGSRVIRFAGLSTSEESVGEGLADDDA